MLGVLELEVDLSLEEVAVGGFLVEVEVALNRKDDEFVLGREDERVGHLVLQRGWVH